MSKSVLDFIQLVRKLGHVYKGIQGHTKLSVCKANPCNYVRYSQLINNGNSQEDTTKICTVCCRMMNHETIKTREYEGQSMQQRPKPTRVHL
jgi:hypothetical protein